MANQTLNKILVASLFVFPSLAFGAQSSFAQGADLQFEIVNQTRRAIVDFRVDPSSQANWGDNILTEDIGPGETLVVDIRDGKTTCIYDTYTQWSDGTEAIEEQVNMCDSPSWTYTDQ